MGDLIEVYHAVSDTYEQINVPAVYKDMWGQLCSLIDRIEGRPTDAPTIEEAYSAFRVALGGRARRSVPARSSGWRTCRKPPAYMKPGLSLSTPDTPRRCLPAGRFAP